MSTSNRPDILIPRCRLYLSEQRDDGSFEAERYIGDAPEVTLSTAIEEAEARDSGSPTSRIIKR